MRTRSIVQQAIVAGVILFAGNTIVSRLSRNSIVHQLLRRIAESGSASWVFIGSSVVADGIDPPTFQSCLPASGHGQTALNLGLGSSTSVEHYLLAQDALERSPHPRWVVYGFYYDELSRPVSIGWSDLLANRTVVFSARPDGLDAVLPGLTLHKILIRVTRLCPLFVERGLLWARVERLRRVFEGIGMPEVATTRHGRVDDFIAVGQVAGNSRSPVEEAMDRPMLVSHPVQCILDLAKLRGAHVIVVAMPQPSVQRAELYGGPAWTKYASRLRIELGQQGAELISATDWMDDSAFMDRLHLNEWGAESFSKKLAKVVGTIASQEMAATSRPSVD
jgi:hypothetical protein